MEKYGVDEQAISDEQLEKMSAEGCPVCGGEIQRHGNVLVCKSCGTRPFETKKP